MVRIALALALFLTPLAPVHGASPVPAAEIVVLTTAGSSGERTVQLLEALEAEGRLVYGRPSFDGQVFRHCLTEDPNPTTERLDCVRAAIPEPPRARPLVIIILGDTRERGSYQRMECIGPASEGFLRAIYVRDFDHPRPDVSASTRSAAMRCIEDALRSAPRDRD